MDVYLIQLLQQQGGGRMLGRASRSHAVAVARLGWQSLARTRAVKLLSPTFAASSKLLTLSSTAPRMEQGEKQVGNAKWEQVCALECLLVLHRVS